MSKFTWLTQSDKPADQPRAFFIWRDGNYYSDTLICSGILADEMQGVPCPYSVGGRMPEAEPLDERQPDYAPIKGKHGEHCPPCAARAYGDLKTWAARIGKEVPKELEDLRVFRCHQFFWLVVMGLRHDKASVLGPAPPDSPPANEAAPGEV
jgi:hypothetical protein